MSPAETAPLFRPDLEVMTRSEDHAGRVRLVRLVADPLSGSVFELREEDYFICSQLDGERDASSVRAAFEARFGIELEEGHLQAFLAQLRALGLLVGHRPGSSAFLDAALRFLDPDRWARWDLFHPGHLFARLDAATRWCHTRAFGVVAGLVVLLGLGTIWNNWPAFLWELGTLSTWPLVGVIAVYYLCVNLPAVLVQGTTAVHYGGKVEELGVRLLFDVWPIVYCRVRAEGLGRGESCRILFAPVRYGFFAAASALVLWRLVPPATPLPALCTAAALAATINATIRSNPLWATDMAHVLATWTRRQDLRARAVAAARAWLLRRGPTEPLSARDARLFRVYGVAVDLATLATIGGILWGIGELLEAYGGTAALGLLALGLVLYRREWTRPFRRAA